MAETYVYVQSGVVKGFVSLCDDFLAALFVVPASQGEGIGSRLIAKAQSTRMQLGLTVYRENNGAIIFYRRHGFVEIGEQSNEHTGHVELIMKWSV